MWSNPVSYYRPYSKEESDSESGSDSDSGSSTDSGPNFAAFANNLKNAAGPPFPDAKTQQEYGSKYAAYDSPDQKPDEELAKKYGQTKFATESKQQTSLIMLDSRNRDRNAYPQPTAFTLKLPRTYNTIVNIQLTQQSILCSFYYFSPDKLNITIPIVEQGRYIPGTSNLIPFNTTIRQGSYDIYSLITEITNTLNRTPLFYYFPNSFTDFAPIFQGSGNYGLNFNEAGDNYYDPVQRVYTANPSKNSIILNFWNSTNAGLSSYTTLQTKVAYYYPPLKWCFMNNQEALLNLNAGFGIDSSVQTLNDLSTRVLYTFTGLDDPVVTALIVANISQLEAYRLSNTFVNGLVNKYSVYLEPQSQVISISATSLNTSLVTLFTKKQATFLANAITAQSLTTGFYNTLNFNLNSVNVVLQSMYNYLQQQLLSNFAVPWNQYSLSYYANLDYTILLRNGNNVVGIPSDPQSSENAGTITYTDDIFRNLTVQPNYQWARYTGASVSNTIYMTNLSNSIFPNLNHPYDIASKSFILSNQGQDLPFINSNGQIYSDITGTGNCIVPIDASKYTVFQFTSPVRQTLQVETLQRPLDYRIKEYNNIFSPVIQTNFDVSYCFIPLANLPYANTNTLYTTQYDNIQTNLIIQVPTLTWNMQLIDMQTSWASAKGLSVNNANASLYFTFTTPQVPSPDPNSNYRYSLSLQVLLSATSNVGSTYQGLSNFSNDINFFLYHDHAAFQADCLSNKSRYNYLLSNRIPGNRSSATISFKVFPNQTYYSIIRPGVSIFNKFYVTLNPHFTDSNFDSLSLSIAGLNPLTDVFQSNFYQSNFQYASLYDPSFIRLPIQSTLWAAEPVADPSTETLKIQQVPIGYDTNNISTDFTDYIPYIPNSIISFNPALKKGIDPITKYQFNNINSYNQTSKTYIYPGTSNVIMTPGFNTVYSPRSVTKRQVKLCHYYSLTYINDTTIFPPISLFVNNTQTQQAYTDALTGGQITGYNYNTDLVTNTNNLTLGSGVTGFSVIPPEGIWDIDRIMFRSAINNSSRDSNILIKYLGIFPTGIVDQSTVQLSNALITLSLSRTSSYLPGNTDDDSAGYDTNGGSYYEFQKTSGSGYMIGAYQAPGTMVANPKNIYSIIAFDVNSNISYIRALSGSLVPYPFKNAVGQSNKYLDGSSAPNPAFNVVYPRTTTQTQYPFVGSFENPAVYNPIIDKSQSVFEQSQPIGTSVLHYMDGGVIKSAWQIFYPFQKISLIQIANSQSQIANSNTINYPEYAHTQMFYYSNYAALSNDINNSWGLESNYTVLDTQFSGSYFNSYIYDMPVRKSASSNDYQYIAVRNMTPTERSEVLMRFAIPGSYNFGYATIQNLIDETKLIAASNTSNFNMTYSQTISNFNNSFMISNVTWGADVLSNYYGSTMNFSNFTGFMQTYSNLYQIYTIANTKISTINNTVTTNIYEYLGSQFSSILPSNVLTSQSFMNEIPFSLTWSSSLTPQYKKLQYNWGLGFNLGYAKEDTPFTTYARANSFYKIIDQYIYLKMSPEYNMNQMDTTASEDYSVTRSPTGTIHSYHAKILLNNFGSFAQTSVITAAALNPPIPRLEKISFQLLDITGAVINNNDCDWTASLQIVEQIVQATTDSVVPKLPA